MDTTTPVPGTTTDAPVTSTTAPAAPTTTVPPTPKPTPPPGPPANVSVLLFSTTDGKAAQCSLAPLGSSLSAFNLTDTRGACASLTAATSGMFPGYYSTAAVSGADGSVRDLRLLCNSSSCADDCALVLSGTANQHACHHGDGSSGLDLALVFFSAAAPCFGPTDLRTSAASGSSAHVTQRYARSWMTLAHRAGAGTHQPATVSALPGAAGDPGRAERAAPPPAPPAPATTTTTTAVPTTTTPPPRPPPPQPLYLETWVGATCTAPPVAPSVRQLEFLHATANSGCHQRDPCDGLSYWQVNHTVKSGWSVALDCAVHCNISSCKVAATSPSDPCFAVGGAAWRLHNATALPLCLPAPHVPWPYISAVVVSSLAGVVLAVATVALVVRYRRRQHARRSARLAVYRRLGAAKGSAATGRTQSDTVDQTMPGSLSSSIDTEPVVEERVFAALAAGCGGILGLVGMLGAALAFLAGLVGRAGVSVWGVVRILSRAVSASVGRGYITIDSRETMEMLVYSVGVLGLVPVAVVWYVHRPFTIFGLESLQRVGLNTTYVNAEREHAVFAAWEQTGDGLLFFLLAVAVLAGVGRLCLLRPRDLDTWSRVRSTAVGAVLLGVLVLNMLPPFVVPMQGAFSIWPSNGSFLTGSAAARAELNDALGYSFAGIFFSFMALQLFFMLLAVTPAFYLAACFVCTRIAWRQRVNELAAVETCFRLRLTLCVVLFLGPVSTSMPVIILYQSFGLSSWMLVAWLGSATYPFVFFYYLRRLLNRMQCLLTYELQSVEVSEIYSSLSTSISTAKDGTPRHAKNVREQARELSRVRRSVWMNMFLFVVCYAASTAVLLYSVSFFNEIDLIYPTVLSGGSLLIAFSASVLLLMPSREELTVRW